MLIDVHFIYREICGCDAMYNLILKAFVFIEDFKRKFVNVHDV